MTPDATWKLLLAARDWRTRAIPAGDSFGIRLASGGEPRSTEVTDVRAGLIWRNPAFEVGPALPAWMRDLVELYLPVLGASAQRSVVVGHLGQSLDAQIATGSGDSRDVTGPENMIHLHRMRALCDAVIVGAGTVAADDPRLTTRLVAGRNPVRVVIDPERRLARGYRVFEDGEATTLLVCGAERLSEREAGDSIIGVPRNAMGLDLAALIAALARRGLHALFVEGGGITVSRWVTAGLLDRLQIATSPVLIGAGRPGLRLPPVPTMRDCRRPSYRLFQMGQDILWDFDLCAEPIGVTAQDPACRMPVRLR